MRVRTVQSVPIRGMIRPATKTIELTFDKAIEAARVVDVDEYGYSLIVRSHGKQPSDAELLVGLVTQAIGSDIRFDFIVGDQCRWTKIGNRY